MMKGLGTAAASAAVLMLSGTGGAYAADLGPYPVKAVPAASTTCTTILDFFTTACQLSAYGVRFYGTIDVGYGYQSAGAPVNNLLGTDFFLGKPSNRGIWTLAPNGMSTSNVGFQIKEPLGAGWSFVGQIETAFNPVSFQVLDGPASLRQGIGQSISAQTAINDSAFQGTPYNSLGFAGVSNDTWGTLTFGRQNSLFADQVLAYDPLGSAAAFSALGQVGTYAGGGNGENRRDTTALKYRVNWANWHFGAYAQLGGYAEGNGSNGGYAGNIGADYHLGPGLFSADVSAGWRKDAVNEGVGGLSGSLLADGTPYTGALLSSGLPAEFLNAAVSDISTVMVSTKYQWDRLKLYAGYEFMSFSNGDYSGSTLTDEDGNTLVRAAAQTAATGPTIFGTTTFSGRHLNIAWFGGKYALTDSLDLGAAYYHFWQNDFSQGAGVATVTTAGAPTGNKVTCSQVSDITVKCAGSEDQVSAMLDWKFAPKWDTYIGTSYIAGQGGLVSGYVSHNDWVSTAGVRFRW
jgi:predicted porin